ncbi:MAG: polyribonucleotide nucleotidyltransferase [Bacteroidia bacterium]|nr:polyribonucleotide nucleotidyltransferase [Bacteroidia bacterium]
MQRFSERLEWAEGEALTLETGWLAKQADGAVLLRKGDTMLLATVVARKEIDPNKDFLPLSVDYRENYASAGKIPGGFFKRDGRSNEYEILTSRVVDRSIRPLFPEGYFADIQVLITLLSSDPEVKGDSLACVAASAALLLSDIPFPEPVATVRVCQIGGQLVLNPKTSSLEHATLDLIVAGTPDSITMVEGEMREVSEEVMLEALRLAHAHIKELNALQLKLQAQCGKPKRAFEPKLVDADLEARVHALAKGALADIVAKPVDKQARSEAYDTLWKQVLETLLAERPELADDDDQQKDAKRVFGDLKWSVVREHYLSTRTRLDGRKGEDIRPIWIGPGYLPRAHGSALFTRGETQALGTVTLGTKLDEQMIDYATLSTFKRFLLQYNFPPFSTGEVKPLRAPARREVGHGNLAERALKNMLPEDIEYTIRVTSDVLESNGSSSMATVCAGSLALMDAGIKIKAAVSGIAMGLIVDGDRYMILSDILGDEDHLGDMDFKTTGTANGLTACQMDIQVRGLSFEILSEALAQAKRGREHILSKMNEVLAEPRAELSRYAPRMLRMEIPSDMIGAVIGTGGKVIQEIQRTSGAIVNIEEVAQGNKTIGVVTISSPDTEKLETALARINAIVIQPEVGETYDAKVKFLKEAGAVLEFMGGKEGWLHISEISWKRVETIEGTLEVGEEFPVQLLEVDPKTGRYRLSRKALLPKPEGYEERPPRPPRQDGEGHHGRGPRRDNGRGPRRNDRQD